MFSPIFLRERYRTFPHLLHSLTIVRSMGGGPRTFPNGLNKWQWKRLHEKKAKEKEKRLLQQEKQLYQARVRSEIRSKLVDPNSQSNQPKYSPLSPKDHIKALADRFMKDGAEDLWNEADGPVVSSQSMKPAKYESNGHSFDLRKLITGQRNVKSISPNVNSFQKPRHYSVSPCSVYGNLSNYEDLMHLSNLSKPRHYSVYLCSGHINIGNCYDFENSMKLSNWSKNPSHYSSHRKLGNCNESEKSTNLSKRTNRRFDSVYKSKSGKSSRFNFRKNDSSSDEESDDEGWLMTTGDTQSRGLKIGSVGKDLCDDDSEADGGGGNGKKMKSSAALGNYDRKIKKRVPLKFVEDEDDLTQHVQAIRKEFNKRKMAEHVTISTDEDSILSHKRFDECNVSPLTVKALTSAGYVQMSRLQEGILSACLDGKDALVKAKTGTGKSAAFLLPAIETVLKASISTTARRAPQFPPICVLILCPTRELASQIAAEAYAMVKYHDGIGVQTLVGGTRFKLDQKRLESDPCQIIVATPGRLLDHIENKYSFSTRLMKLSMLIVDEADHLLDLGFRKDMEKIVDCLPRQRQSLLFSATLPKEVRRISQLVLKREHVYIDTLGLGCVGTPVKVKQSYLVAPHEQHFEIVHHLLKEHIAQVPDYKVIVFCTTANMTSLMFSLLHEMKMNVREIHSRKPQLVCTRVSDEFKEAKRLILITSDVSACGLSYPDVSLIIQVGIPTDCEQYKHRLGRTGWESKEGEGILLLAPWEEYFLGEIKDLPLEKSASPHLDPDIKIKIKNSMGRIDTSVKEAAYHAWLDYYNSNPDIGRDKTKLVELANGFCETIGLKTPPALFRKTAVKMGLKDIPGIRVRK